MHRGSDHPARTWLAPLLGVLAFAAFPAAAGAATPAPTPCATPPASAAPCYTAAPAVSPASEFTNPPEGRILTVPLTPPQTGSPGTWSGTAPIKYTYRWQDCDAATGLTCTDIAGATSRTYTVAQSDVGSRLQFVVTATNSAGTGYAVLQSAGAAVAAVPINRVAPSLSGPSQDGQSVTANPGSWTGSQPITYTYQWRHCDANGKNCDSSPSKWFPATPSSSPTYVLQDSDLGHTMSVVVTATNSAGKTVQGSFATTNVVTPGNIALPKISGTAEEGKTLTESNGSWLPKNSKFTYQWESCNASGGNCSAIAGATSQTYALTSADVGHEMVVQETASQNGVNSSPASSAPTGVVRSAPSSGGGSGGSQGGSGGSQGGSGGSQGGGKTGGSHSSVSGAQLRRLLRNALSVHGNGARIGALLKHGGYSFTFAAPVSGRLTISWSLRRHGRKVVIAKVSVLFRRSGKAKINVLLTSQGRGLLKGSSRMTLAAQGGFKPVGRSTTSVTRTITLKG
jgi:hypothetical protein